MKTRLNSLPLSMCCICIAALLLTGCYTPRYVYSPSAHNVPLLAKKGDSKVGINYSSNLPGNRNSDDYVSRGRSHGIDVQGAFAITNKLALQANHFFRSEINGGNYTTSLDSAEIRYRRNLTEIGAGYYTKINPESNLIFQLFAGIGFGKFTFTDNGNDANQLPYSRFHRAAIFKFYLQPAFQYQNEKKIAAALSSRFSVINFSNIETDYTPEEQANFELDGISSSPVVFWEPAFVTTLGFKKLPGFFLEYQAGLSLLVSRRFVDARSFNFSAGVNVDLRQLLKKKVPVAEKVEEGL